MRVIDCAQRSPEWYAARVGLLTASNAAAMLSTGRRGGEAVGKTELRLRLALEGLRGTSLDGDHYESPWMRRGREIESEALDAYEVETGEIVQVVGFLRHDTLPIGCSPDGIVGNFAGGVELKCPKFTTHFEYVTRGTLPSEYVAQVTHSLLVTALPWWDFCSYCPEFDGDARLFRVRVMRADVNLDAYALACHLFVNEVETVKDTLRALSARKESHAEGSE